MSEVKSLFPDCPKCGFELQPQCTHSLDGRVEDPRFMFQCYKCCYREKVVWILQSKFNDLIKEPTSLVENLKVMNKRINDISSRPKGHSVPLWKGSNPASGLASPPEITDEGGENSVKEFFDKYPDADQFGDTVYLTKCYLTYEEIMELPDEEIVKLTDDDLWPRIFGEQLADIVSKQWEAVFAKKVLPSGRLKALPSKQYTALDLLFNSKLVSSKSDARRVIRDGGFKIDGTAIRDAKELIDISKERVLQKGKKDTVRVINV